MSLSSTPPEMLLNIMESLSVEDIVRAAQSCSYLRRFVLSNKLPLAKAYNRASTLHLPLGSTIKDLSPEILYAHAAKSVAISTRLSKSINSVPLEPRQSIAYSLEALDTKWDQEYHTTFFVRDKMLAFLNPNGLFVLFLGPSGEIERHIHTSLNLSGGTHKVAYQMSADEKTLFVVFVTGKYGADTMQVFEIGIAEEEFGAVTVYLEIRLPRWMHGWRSVAIQDPYCVVADERSLFLVDWRAQSGGVYRPFYQADDQSPGLIQVLRNILSVQIHPQEPLLVLFDNDETGNNPNSGIYLLEIPEFSGRHLKNLNDLTDLDSSYSKTERSLTWKLPFGTVQRCDERDIRPIGFRCLSDSSWILDVLIIGRQSFHELFFPGEGAPTENKPLVRVSFDSSQEWTAQVQMTDATSVKWYLDNSSPYGNPQTAGSVFFYRSTEAQDNGPVAVPKFEDGNENGSGFIRLFLPSELWTVDSNDEIDRLRRILDSAIFDQLTGRLYLAHPQGFQILQY
ncbi:hypothetical protein SISSUDRAFT_1037215 [Sistotremastrum suecicum HHB10207 ss-3]|uniref:F-box domain-containing protein n=1 Tax=Sistotremastrum suecicum HHB10207 ss-3 TaxID=1314776 RepID=A0A165YFK8_9AGAM|nr:hypothetical protein SISSUDRAFT_1037215 [Sistotremastrum suecicum HHB10207 ss-3]